MDSDSASADHCVCSQVIFSYLFTDWEELLTETEREYWLMTDRLPLELSQPYLLHG